MKIGVISDTHIPVYCENLPSVLKKYFQDVDMILHAGDIVDPCVLDRLRRICPSVEAVCGNMDGAQLQQELPQKKVIVAGSYKIGLIHGWGAPSVVTPDKLRKEFKGKKLDVIVFGHSHKPFNEEHDGILFLNPGSATDTIYADCPTIALLELGQQQKKATIIEL